MHGLRMLGHPLHAMLSDFPMVLLLAWAALDLAALFFGAPTWTVGRWSLIAGLIAAGVAAGAGFVDLLAVGEEKPQAQNTALLHGGCMLAAATVALVALLFRAPAQPASGEIFWLSALAPAVTAALLIAGGWLGGHLVFHYGVGRD